MEYVKSNERFEELQYFSDIFRHLICIPYSVENLHKMAKNLKISRSWYESKPYPHYDIPKRRLIEIQEKTKIIKSTVLLKMIK
jgi:hypothetical protein